MARYLRAGAVIGLLLCALLPARTVGSAPAQEIKDVMAAAQVGLPLFLGQIPTGSESSYGFKSRAEFEKAGLGTPIAVLTVVPESIRDSIPTSKNLFVPVSEYRVPVAVNGEMRALLTISTVKGNWRAVDFGGAGLATELHQFIGSRPAGTSGKRLELLRLYQLHCDFVILSDTVSAATPAVYPLRSAVLMLERNSQATEKVYSREKLLPLLREDFRREAASEN